MLIIAYNVAIAGLKQC